MNLQAYLQPVKKFWKRWQNRRHRDFTPLWAATIFLVVLGNAVLIYFTFFYEPKTNNEVPIDNEENIVETGFVSPLTGLPVAEDEMNLRPMAAMIDNYSGARPQAGLSNASLVWELYVEGGVTRLLAIFQNSSDTNIGPVRSAREYFLPIVNAFDAVYAHSGGSPAALNELAKGAIDDADEFKYASTYFRSRFKNAPHNLFTTTEKLHTLAEKKDWTEWDWKSNFVFNKEAPSGEQANEVTVNYSSSEYNTRWSYDEDQNKYRRFVDGDLTFDADNEEVLAYSNVLILFTEVRPAPRPNYPDAVYVETVGSGDALFVRDGVVIDGRWRISKTGQIEFTQTNGAPYSLAPGSTWVQMVSADILDNVVVR